MAAPARYGSVPFREQIEFYRRKLNVKTEAWTDIFAAQHDVAFMVAGANRDDLVADFREAVRKAIEDGATLEEFRRDFDSIVAKYGWDYEGGRNWRSRVIYETNLRQSYNAGRWTQLYALKDVLPYWRYRHSDAVETPRPIHESWNFKIWRWDDPIWQYISPANGWGCQCWIEGLSERDMQRDGLQVSPPLDLQFVDVIVGKNSPGGPRTVRTPVGVDPGFGYAPGRSIDTPAAPALPEPDAAALQVQLERAVQTALEKSARLPAETAANSALASLTRPRIVRAIDTGYAQWQSAVLAETAASSSYGVGAIEPTLVRSLAQAGIEPATAAINISKAHVAVAELSQLPAILRAPSAVLLDRASNVLVYVAGADLRNAVVTVNYRLASQAGTETINTLGNASFTLAQIRSELQAGRLELLQGTLE